mmetsp:Transcript_4626/g.13363  ORF Transcript_4626/g.13363 Transcript_4626/m.13363 type:complete len:224 (+) Transcript_4626:702-1373(+)
MEEKQLGPAEPPWHAIAIAPGLRCCASRSSFLHSRLAARRRLTSLRVCGTRSSAAETTEWLRSRGRGWCCRVVACDGVAARCRDGAHGACGGTATTHPCKRTSMRWTTTTRWLTRPIREPCAAFRSQLPAWPDGAHGGRRATPCGCCRRSPSVLRPHPARRGMTCTTRCPSFLMAGSSPSTSPSSPPSCAGLLLLRCPLRESSHLRSWWHPLLGCRSSSSIRA